MLKVSKMFFFCLIRDAHGRVCDAQDSPKAHTHMQIYKRSSSGFQLNNVNLGESKGMALGKGLVPFREGFMRWEHMGNIQEVRARKPRVYQKRRSLENQSLIFGSFCHIF